MHYYCAKLMSGAVFCRHFIACVSSGILRQFNINEEKEAEATIHCLHLRAAWPEMIDVQVINTHDPT